MNINYLELMWIGLSGLLLMAIWSFGLQKSILDDHRDRLFDLRDQLRSDFISNNIALSSSSYKRMRDQINAYLYFTENFSLTKFLIVEYRFHMAPNLNELLSSASSVKEDFLSEREAAVIAYSRERSMYIITSYMIMSSGFLLTLMLLMSPFILFYLGSKFIANGIHAGGISVLTKAIRFNTVMIKVIKFAVGTIGRFLFNEKLVEIFSLEQAHQSRISFA